MEKKTFDSYDKLDLEAFGSRLTSFIESESAVVDGSLTISLNGSYGCGKSTFLEMWQQQIIAEEKFEVIYLNAWESDYQRDSLLAIISAFIRHYKEEGTQIDEDKLRTTAGKLGKFALAIGNGVVENFTGINIQDAKEKTEADGAGILGKACFDAFADRQDAFLQLKSALKEMIKGQDKPVILIVDELDRCRPDYAVEYLETIKHFFDIENVTFVLGVDKESLRSSVSVMFGSSIKFSEYYRKFVHRNVQFPKLETRTTSILCTHLVERYITSDSLSKLGIFTRGEMTRERKESLVDIVLDLQLGPRQIHEMFRIISHIMRCDKNAEGKLLWGFHTGAMFIAALAAKDHPIYHEIGTGNIELNGLTSFIKELPNLSGRATDNEWWPLLLFTGTFDSKIATPLALIEELTTLGFDPSEMTEQKVSDRRADFVSGFDRYGRASNRPFRRVYDQIEEVKRFGEV